MPRRSFGKVIMLDSFDVRRSQSKLHITHVRTRTRTHARTHSIEPRYKTPGCRPGWLRRITYLLRADLVVEFQHEEDPIPDDVQGHGVFRRVEPGLQLRLSANEAKHTLNVRATFIHKPWNEWPLQV